MRSRPSLPEVVEDVSQSILATPRLQRRLLSRTFWKKFGFRRRSDERIAAVAEALRQKGISVDSGETEFGREDNDAWLVLTNVEAPPITEGIPLKPQVDVVTPSDSWFERVKSITFESEREVEHFFVVPLLEQLGYDEEDLVIGYGVEMYQGVKKVRAQADFVLFNGSSRTKEDALLLVEAKRTSRGITDDAIGQARSYAMALSTPRYLVTDGEQLMVYRFRGAILPDVLLIPPVKRQELRQRWDSVFQNLSKKALIAEKERLVRDIERMGAA